MTDYSLEKIKELRSKTGVSINECRKALIESNGDINKAIEILRKRGQKVALSKQNRQTKNGVVSAYIHSNKRIGVLVVLTCETDFVARNKEFQELAHDLALQIAAAKPKWISPDDIPSDVLNKEREIYLAELKDSKKPKEIIDKIIEGKLKKFYSEFCLLEQPFIKDEKITIKQLITDKIAKLGENIKIQEFTRYEI
ncbi:elongation factor Ts [bacterium]|nr:elongation factor Ts [bacterium]